MKRLILLLIMPLAAMIISSCNTSNDPVSPELKGSIYLTSNPAGTQIWLDGANTSKITPDTLLDVNEGVHNVTLKFQDFNDTTFAISVTGNQMSIVTNIVLVSNIVTTLFGPVRIYETVGTSASEPSGLDLSSGIAYGVSSSQNDSVDIYYSSTGFLVQSADLYPNLIRKTDFFVGSGTSLFDGVDSPLKNTGTWTNNIGDRESDYVFLYDHDGHYSKLKIINWGGGVPGEPAWVEVQWYYNNIRLDPRF
jgi:PEGA domain